MAGACSTIISKGMRYRKLSVNPLESVLPQEYCRFCHDEVDVEIDQGKWGSIWVYRKRCLRCGQRIQWGIATEYLQSADPVILKEVAQWIQQTGEDRR